jgi:hypothetical protein
LYQKGTQGIVTEQETRGNNSAFVLKDVFCWGDSSVGRIVAGEDITEEILEKASFADKKFIQGRALLDLGKTTMRTVKKALAILISKLKPCGGLDSGNSVDDLYKIVLDEMYVLLKGRTALKEDISLEASDDEDEAEEGTRKAAAQNTNKTTKKSDRPSDWTFNGWFVLLMFGPTAPKAQQINLLCLNDPPKDEDKKKYGREAQRTEEKVQNEKERSRGGGERGLSMNEKIGVGNLMVRQKQQGIDKTDSRIFGFTAQQQLLESKIERATTRAFATQDFTQVDLLEAQSDAIGEKIRLLLESPASIVGDAASSSKKSIGSKSSTLSTLESIFGSNSDMMGLQEPKKKKMKPTPNPPPRPNSIVCPKVVLGVGDDESSSDDEPKEIMEEAVQEAVV